MKRIEQLLDMSWCRLILWSINVSVGLHLTLVVLKGIVYFATEPDALDPVRAMSLFSLVWAIGALHERRRS